MVRLTIHKLNGTSLHSTAAGKPAPSSVNTARETPLQPFERRKESSPKNALNEPAGIGRGGPAVHPGVHSAQVPQPTNVSAQRFNDDAMMGTEPSPSFGQAFTQHPVEGNGEVVQQNLTTQGGGEATEMTSNDRDGAAGATVGTVDPMTASMDIGTLGERTQDDKAMEAEIHAWRRLWKFLNNPDGVDTRLDDAARAHIRASVFHLPEAATACYDSARDSLVTREGVIKCIYHHKSDKSSKINDQDSPTNEMTGVPLQGAPSGKGKGDSKQKGGGSMWSRFEVHVEGGVEYAHCGCTVQDTVWGLYLWKRMRISYGGRTQLYIDTVPPTLKIRGFMITLLQLAGIELNNVWLYERVGAKLQGRLRDLILARPSPSPTPLTIEQSLLLSFQQWNEELDDEADGEENGGPELEEDGGLRLKEEHNEGS
ncbi:hypothetical protein AAF712_010421 [Marasmius tenuissimus]|uniref:Uncharacterized protein n=1 Tax=Marasmius tenuissimus TaxID=585030 RepID=A0ABR2ZMC3_9AGAR